MLYEVGKKLTTDFWLLEGTQSKMNPSVSNNSSKMTTDSKMFDFKKMVLETEFPKMYINTTRPMPDTKSLGVFVLTRVIPKMEEDGDIAFAWGWAKNDLIVYNNEEYTTETKMYKKEHKLRCDKGDQTWFFDYTKGGKKRRCIINTEIWYDPNEHHNLSPTAILFGQYMGNGLHIAKCKWVDVE